MSKMSDYCREIERLSKQTGYSMQYILEQIDVHENEIAESSMKTGYQLTYIVRQFVAGGFNISAIRPLNEKERIVLMGDLAEKYVRGEISIGEYFDRLELIKQGRSA